ncbi:hypothetical protein V8B97DRAFT_230395 [Scleroderma yunnanense]
MIQATSIDAFRFSPTLYKLISDEVDINMAIVDYVVDCIVEAVKFTEGHPRSPTRASQLIEYAIFKLYVASVLRASGTNLDTIFIALAFVNRLKLEEPFGKQELACEKMFIGSLILAKKFTEKCSLQDRKWTLCSRIFGKADIDTLENDALTALDFELEVEKGEVVLHQVAFSKMALGDIRYYRPGGQLHASPPSVFSYSSAHWKGRSQTNLTPRRWWKAWLSSKLQTAVA